MLRDGRGRLRPAALGHLRLFDLALGQTSERQFRSAMRLCPVETCRPASAARLATRNVIIKDLNAGIGGVRDRVTWQLRSRSTEPFSPITISLPAPAETRRQRGHESWIVRLVGKGRR